MTRSRIFTAVLTVSCSASILTGCGGGGGGNSSSPPPVTVTPTPTPAPTPPPTYGFGYTASEPRDFTSGAAYLVTVSRLNDYSGAVLSTDGGMLADDTYRMTYSPNPLAATIKIGNEVDVRYSADQRTTNHELWQVFGITSGGYNYDRLIYTTATFSPNFQYVAESSFYQQVADEVRKTLAVKEWRTVLGQATVTTDLPQTGSKVYVGRLFTYGATQDSRINAPVYYTVDWAKGTISGDGLSSFYPGDTRYIVSGTIDRSTNTVTGSIRGDNALYQGRFTGRFYGPRGAELGLIVSMNSGNVYSAGTLILR